jgi:hypothetical protein
MSPHLGTSRSRLYGLVAPAQLVERVGEVVPELAERPHVMSARVSEGRLVGFRR